MTLDQIIANKEVAIATKKATLKEAPSILHTPKASATKAENKEQRSPLLVKIVANSSNILDSHMDVHIKGNYDNSIANKEGYLHLNSHVKKLESRIGIVKSVTTEEITLSELGIDKEGTTQCLVYTSEIIKELAGESIYHQYKNGYITEHSIGMYYKDIALAINDPKEEEEYKTWTAHFSKIINQEKAIESGYFWVVKEIELIECSAVLKGSNYATPTLEISGKELQDAIADKKVKQNQIQQGIEDKEEELLRVKRFRQLSNQ